MVSVRLAGSVSALVSLGVTGLVLRMATSLYLNYRNIPYKTEWVSYPDIKPTLSALGFKGTSIGKDGTPHYTVPSIIDPTPSEPTLVEDSARIAEYLEKAYPPSDAHPALLPEELHSEIQDRINLIRARVYDPIGSMIIACVPDALEDPRGREYYLTTREKYFGFPLPDFLPEGSDARKENWEQAKKALDELDAAFATREGVFFFGDTMTYADVVLGALFSFAKDIPDSRDGPDVSSVWQLIEPLNDGRWSRFMEKMEQYRFVK